MASLTLGQRIYYTGDMANAEDSGTVVAVNPPTSYTRSNGQTVQILGVTYDIECDDGRSWRGITPAHFAPGPGRRFWLLDEWREHSRRRMDASMQAMRQAIAQEK